MQKKHTMYTMHTMHTMERGTLQMNRTKRISLAAAALAAMLFAAPVCAQAMDTAPLVPNAQAEQRTQERIPPFGNDRSFRGVTASTAWMRQARIGGMMLNLRVFTAMGEEVVFQENLGAAQDCSMCLYLLAYSDESNLMFQLDQYAVDVLDRVGVKQIVVADKNGYVRMRYQVDELAAVRRALALEDAEQLCVSGENDPVTVVSADGVRRRAAQ